MVEQEGGKIVIMRLPGIGRVRINAHANWIKNRRCREKCKGDQKCIDKCNRPSRSKIAKYRLCLRQKKSVKHCLAEYKKKRSVKRKSKKRSVKRASKKRSVKRASKKRSVKRASKKRSVKRVSKKRSVKRASKKRSVKRASKKRSVKRASKKRV